MRVSDFAPALRTAHVGGRLPGVGAGRGSKATAEGPQQPQPAMLAALTRLLCIIRPKLLCYLGLLGGGWLAASPLGL